MMQPVQVSRAAGQRVRSPVEVARSRAWPVLAVLAYVLLGVGYLEEVPAWEAPDEPWHAAYAETLAEGSFPTPDDTYEAHQPPGFYIYLAGLLKVLGGEPVPRPVESPYFPFAEAVYWHPPDDPGAAAARLLRFFAGLLAAAGVAMTWAVARRLSAPDRLAPGLAALAVALLPQYQFIGHALSNDGLAATAGGLFTYGAARLVRPRRRKRGRDSGLMVPVNDPSKTHGPVLRWLAAPPGLLAAAAFLAATSKLTALAVLPAAVVAALTVGLNSFRGASGYGTGSAYSGVRLAASALAAMGLAIGLAALAHAVLVPTGWSALLADLAARAGTVRTELMTPPVVLALTRDTLISMWGRFGWLTVNVPYPLLHVVAATAAVGLVGIPVAIWRRQARVDIVLIYITAIGSVCGAVAKNMLADPQPQGRFLFPALAALAALLSAGWLGLAPGRVRAWVVTALAGAMLAANLHIVATILPTAYAPWRREPENVLIRVLPEVRVVTTRLDGAGARARQTFTTEHPVSKVALAVHRGSGGGEVEMRLLAGRSVVASRRLQVDELERDRWISVETVRPERAAEWAVEIELVGGDGEVRLWGSGAEAYGGGRLVEGDAPTDRDLALVVATVPAASGAASAVGAATVARELTAGLGTTPYQSDEDLPRRGDG